MGHNTNKRVSVITVVWNAAQELDSTLRNIESLDYPLVEIIVIDGGSTDGTVEVIEQHSDRITHRVSEPDKGLYDAMNKGLRAATGDYVWFINAGDRAFESDVLSKIFSANSEDADIYYGETMVCSANGQRLGLRKKPLPRHLTWRSLWRGMVVCHQSFIVKREIAPLYNLQYKYVADIDWVIECLKAAQSRTTAKQTEPKRMIVNTGLILSEFAEGGISTRSRRASLRERWKVMRKHYGFVTTAIAHMIFILETPFRKKYRNPKIQ